MRRPGVRSSVVLALPVLCAVKLLAGLGMTAQGGITQPVSEVMRLPTGWQLNRGPMGPMRTEVALAPDGTSLVFAASPDGTMPKARLYRRLLDRADATVVPGTPEGVCMPIFSPDGRSVAYWAAEKIFKVPVNGGSPVAVCNLTPRPFGMSWSPDGRIVFGRQADGLAYVRADGGTPAALTTVDTTVERTHRLPHVLPNGDGLLFTAMLAESGIETRLEWLSLKTGRRKVLVADAADGRYLPTGHLVFVRKGALMAVPFDFARLETRGPAVTVVPQLMHAFNSIMPDMNSGAGQYSVSTTGVLAWASGGTLPDYVSQFFWVDRGGRAEPWPVFRQTMVSSVRLSPDGRRLAFNSFGFDRGVFVYDIRRNTTTKLTSDGRTVFNLPFWTSDGRRIGFSWYQMGRTGVWWVPADGQGKIEKLLPNDASRVGSCWSRDGKYLAFLEDNGDVAAGLSLAGLDIKVLSIADGHVTTFAGTKAVESFPEFSPDGRWLAYVSNESGRNEVYARSFPDGRRTVQITTEGGSAPVWAPGGRELFYFDLAFKKLTQVDISTGHTVTVGNRRVLFEFSATSSQMLRTYDITPDGERFLIQKARNSSPAVVTELNVERRWFDRVRRISVPAS